MSESCLICGEELTDEEIETPMNEYGICDDCEDEDTFAPTEVQHGLIPIPSIYAEN